MDGIFQGHGLASLLLCVGLRRALRRFATEYKEMEPDYSVTFDILGEGGPQKGFPQI